MYFFCKNLLFLQKKFFDIIMTPANCIANNTLKLVCHG